MLAESIVDPINLPARCHGIQGEYGRSHGIEVPCRIIHADAMEINATHARPLAGFDPDLGAINVRCDVHV